MLYAFELLTFFKHVLEVFHIEKILTMQGIRRGVLLSEP